MALVVFAIFWLIGVTVVPLFLWFKINPHRKISIILLVINILFVLDFRFNYLTSMENENGTALVGLLFITPFLMPIMDIIFYLGYKLILKFIVKYQK